MATISPYNIYNFKLGTGGITPIQSDNSIQFSTTAYVWGKVPLTTKGDLLTNNGTVNQRLGVGALGTLLYPNPNATLGLSYNTFITDVSSTTTFSTASTTDVAITNMNRTPGLGTYTCLFSGTIFNSTNNVLMSISIYINGVIVTGSTFEFRNASTQNRIPFTYGFPITVTNSIHTVEIRAKTSAGTMTITNRYMALIRKSN